ncbi:hypothetical protein RJ639_047329 [Escallonia herrerae]|uniref:TSL-kinase interacting protein 1 n=1 Tax=Escallonia herrerae TaxID=1293975 RepID=A0AA88W6J3_9ASTE|nr:hypothetical protein RJ639_047329 [Escallonia herrerae]
MEPQVSSECEACLRPVNTKDGDPGVTKALQDQYRMNRELASCTLLSLINAAKKQTRQWAAWTREEEESFFNALRQVGKAQYIMSAQQNFEKITRRVQSKNKDQVRHYYYRLVRRMNKLLGPELCLDARNSKDTNTAMLRWWSLLEKYSCKASKLHLKPRRFKIFMESLELQLWKDRKKNTRKRHSQAENCSTTLPNQARALGHDARPFKGVLIDSQNIQKTGISRSNCKGGSSPIKSAKKRRKPVTASTAAYKRWEKAAIAGVSMVADAAEQLERTATDPAVEHDQGILGEKAFHAIGKEASLQNLQTSMKLKLQLFPIDDDTRRALELDNLNPHLELTLSTRKKISSVLEHLNRKWGSSSVASGELMLRPYCSQIENLMGCHKWTQNSDLSAADVYALIGSPQVFRLRYGWSSIAEHGYATLQAPPGSASNFSEHNVNIDNTKGQKVDPLSVSTPPTEHETERLMNSYKYQLGSVARTTTEASSSTNVRSKMIACTGTDPNDNLSESSHNAPSTSWGSRETGNRANMRRAENTDNLRLCSSTPLSAGEWADSLTNISIGDLLSEVSHNADANCTDSPLPSDSQCLQPIPFSCDSFDAAIAAHIRKHQSKAGSLLTLASHTSSIWDAEETCDAFSFQRKTIPCEKLEGASRNTSPEAHNLSASTSLVASGAAEECEADEPMDGDPAHEDPMDECQSDLQIVDNSAKDLSGLTDMYWPDSLGPLDLDVPSCRYHSDDLILSDSLGGLNRLIASSLDAFQNCSFFGLDKKEPASTVEARESASFSDYKIGSQV